jgi:hypothetical protein
MSMALDYWQLELEENLSNGSSIQVAITLTIGKITTRMSSVQL